MPLIVIDPGHGGADSGAVGQAGTRESDVNLTLAYYLKERLNGLPVTLTRTDDSLLSLPARIGFADNAAAFISLHCNAAENPNAQGFEVFTSRGVTRADALASYIFRSVINVSPAERRFRSDWSDGDEDKEAGFYVLTHTPCPAVLIETAFISNAMEEQQLRDDTFLRLQACAIGSGIERWLD